MEKNKEKKVTISSMMKKYDLGKYLKTFVILFTLSIILSGIFAISAIQKVSDESQIIEYENNFETFYSIMKTKTVTILLMVACSFVPYCYLPIVGFLLYTGIEAMEIGYSIGIFGFLGFTKAIVPFLMNIFIISVLATVGIYICKRSTAKYRLSRLNSISFNNLRMKVYEYTKQTENLEKLKEKQEQNNEKISKGISKFNYKGYIALIVTLLVIQIISSLLTMWSY